MQIFYGVISVCQARAQYTKPTRNKTESWLLNKLNRYVSSSKIECHRFFENNFSKPYESLTYTDVKFHFEGDNLVIDCSTNLVE